MRYGFSNSHGRDIISGATSERESPVAFGRFTKHKSRLEVLYRSKLSAAIFAALRSFDAPYRANVVSPVGFTASAANSKATINPSNELVVCCDRDRYVLEHFYRHNEIRIAAEMIIIACHLRFPPKANRTVMELISRTEVLENTYHHDNREISLHRSDYIDQIERTAAQ